MATLAEELPFAAVVADEHLNGICSSCFASKMERPLSRCTRCKIVHYCGEHCQKKDWVNHKDECLFLENSSAEIPDATCRMIARIAMKLRRDETSEPAFNGRVYEELMDHCDEIRNDPERSMIFLTYSRVLRDYMGDKVPDSDLLMSMYGKVMINAFMITGDTSIVGEGLHLGLSAYDHSCCPDAYLLFDGVKATLRSPDKNKKYSKDLTISYIDGLQSNRDRKQQLQSKYYFTCTCKLCSDPKMDFLNNSARSTCCPDSCCLLDQNAKELTCNNCGAVSGITVKEAIAANEDIKMLYAKNFIVDSRCLSDKSYHLQSLIKTYEKFSKILSPLNINLLMLNDKVFLIDMHSRNHQVGSRYAKHLLPADSMASSSKNIISKPSVRKPICLPEKLWLDVFLVCDKKTLMNLSQVCKYFHRLLNNKFWLRKCHRDGVTVPSPAWDALPKPLLPSDEDAKEPPVKKSKEFEDTVKGPEMYSFDYKKIYYYAPLNKNLAYLMEENTTFDELEKSYGLQFKHGGNGICIERRPLSRSQELQDDPRVKSCFATSFGLCSRYFEIDLVEKGLDTDFLDNIRPRITVRELCCCRDDCGARYEFRVTLLKEGESVHDATPSIVTVQWNQWEGGKRWETVELVLEGYPAGVRRIAIWSGGRDSQFWEGHYGPKFTNTEVIIAMPAIPNWRKNEKDAMGINEAEEDDEP